MSCYSKHIFMKKHIHVAAAVIIQGNSVFAAQRKDSGEIALKWEFPGGKLEEAESGEEAVVREIREELDSTISVIKKIKTVEHEYNSFTLTMDAYLCTLIEGDLVMSEHLDSCWLTHETLYSVDWAEADIPIVDEIYTILRSKL